MKLDKEQLQAMLQMIATSKSDEIACDGCFEHVAEFVDHELLGSCLLYTSPSPRDLSTSRMPSSA